MPETYLVGYDGSPPSKRALDWAVRHAKATGGRVVLATAVPASLKDSFFTTMLLPTLDLGKIVPTGTFEANAKARLDEAAKATGLGERVETRVVQGEAWSALVALAREVRPEALVVGEKSYEKLEEFHLGAIAERVVRHAPCSVVVVR